MDRNRNPEASKEGWSTPLPEHLAQPTYWPAIAALIGWIGDLVA
jgi:hypothetical protein